MGQTNRKKIARGEKLGEGKENEKKMRSNWREEPFSGLPIPLNLSLLV